MKLKEACSLEEKLWKPWWCIKKQRHHFSNKGLCSQSYGFSSSHRWMRELHHKEGWAPKNGCFQIMVLEKTLESSLDSKEIKAVNRKGNQPWIFTEELMLMLQYFGHLMWRVDSLEKILMLGKIEGKRRRGQQRMRWLDCITSSKAWIWANSGDSGGQKGLTCCIHGVAKSWIELNDWPTTNITHCIQEVSITFLAIS